MNDLCNSRGHSSEVAKRGFDSDLSDYRELHVATACGMFVSIHVHVCVYFYVYHIYLRIRLYVEYNCLKYLHMYKASLCFFYHMFNYLSFSAFISCILDKLMQKPLLGIPINKHVYFQ